MRERPAACSIADPSTFITTSRVPIPRPMTRKSKPTSGTDRKARATPMTAIPAATVSKETVTPPRLPRRWRSGVETTRPAIASHRHPSSEQADRSGADAEFRLDCREPGPQAETVIPPRPKPAMMALRHRNAAACSTITAASAIPQSTLPTAGGATASVRGGAAGHAKTSQGGRPRAQQAREGGSWPYRAASESGNPKDASTVLSKRVMAQIRSPASVSTYKPTPCLSPPGVRKYAANAG